MASKVLIPRIPTTPALFTPTTPDFAGYAKQQLGDLGTGTDGFDALFAISAGAIDRDTADAASFDPLISSAAFNPGDFAAVHLAPVDGLLPGFVKDGDALNYSAQNPAPIQGTPTMTPAPAPPTAQSSGGAPVGGTQTGDWGVTAPTTWGSGVPIESGSNVCSYTSRDPVTGQTRNYVALCGQGDNPIGE